MTTVRRGLAMLLVIIGIGAATIVTMAYLSSRDNSAVIGENVADAAAARWAALSGIELACAVMETPTEWWTEHDDGVLFQNYPVGDALVTVELEDFETNEPPDFGARYVTVRSRAVSRGNEQTATGFAELTDPITLDSVNVDLREFAAFATEHIEMSENALISRWRTSPLAPLGLPINLGTHATSAFRIEILHNASVVDGIVYHLDGASEYLFLNPFLRRVEMPDLVPFPAPPEPNDLSDDASLDDMEMIDFGSDLSNGGVLEGDSEVNFFYLDEIRLSSSFSAFDFDGTEDPFIAVVDADFSTTESGTRLGLSGDVIIDVLGNVELDPNTLIDIAPDSKVELRVHGIFHLDEAAIELGEGAVLTLFVRDDVDLRDSYIGDSGAAYDNAGNAEWMDVNRINIFSIMDGDAQDWRFQGNSVVKGQVYAPTARLRIRDDSALYGRAAVQELRLSHNGSIFYDPLLDTGVGYTNPDSQLFTDIGNIRNEFTQLTNLTTQTLEQLSDSVDLHILRSSVTLSTDDDSGLINNTLNLLLGSGSGSGGNDGPTPRVLPVYYDLTSFGDDVNRWETTYVRGAYRVTAVSTE